MVVLCIEQEVRPDDGDTGRHDHEDEGDQQHEAVHVVHLRGGGAGEGGATKRNWRGRVSLKTSNTGCDQDFRSHT